MGYSGTPTLKVLHMTTVNPRVNVTLSPSLDSLVSQLAGFERISKSMVLRELLEAAEPALRQAVALMEAAKGASVTARQNLASDLEAGIKAGEGTSQLMLQNLAHHTRDMVTEAETIRGRRPPRSKAQLPVVASAAKRPRTGRGSGLAPRPPTSNRGVKS